MSYLVKCPSCGKTSVSVGRACSNCGHVGVIAVCAGCGEPIDGQDVKECKGLLVHAKINCWNKCWDSR